MSDEDREFLRRLAEQEGIEVKVRFPCLADRILDYVLSCDEPSEFTGLAERFEISGDMLFEICGQVGLGFFIKGARFEQVEEIEAEGKAVIIDYSTKGTFVIAQKHLTVIERWKEQGAPGC